MEHNTNIVGIYTSPPRKITEKRLSQKISLPTNQTLNNKKVEHNEIMQKWMHIILCYENKSNEDSGWHVGGWIKDALGNALSEHPILAGRIRRSEDGILEIVSNDSGVRCVEAEIPMSLVEFLKSKGTKNEVQGKLVYWEDIDEANLQFSPLFCIQVTNFNCGAYSIGISWHMLLTDTLFMAKFLNKWAKFHRSVAYEGKIHKLPLFNTHNMKQNGCSIPTNGVYVNSFKTMFFDMFTNEKFKSGDEICNYCVLLCLEEVERKIGNKIGSTFTFITRESNGDVKIIVSSKQTLFGSRKNVKYEIKTLNLDDLGMNNVAFLHGNGPIDFSHWISYDNLEAMVLVVISTPSENKFGMKVYITLPSV